MLLDRERLPYSPERRTKPRIAVTFPVTVVAGGNARLNAVCNSISDSGIGIRLSQLLLVGSFVKVMFPNDTQLSMQVMHRELDRYGLCFEEEKEDTPPCDGSEQS